MDKLITFLKDLYSIGQLRYVTCNCITKTDNNDSIVPNHTLAYHTYMYDHTYGRNGNPCCLYSANEIKPYNTNNQQQYTEYVECNMYKNKTFKSLITSLSKYNEYENLFLYISSANITLMDFYNKIMQYKQYITDIDILRATVLKECIDNLPLIYACIQELDMNPSANNITIDAYLAIIKQLNTSL